MPFQRVPNTIGVEVRANIFGVAAENTFYATYGAKPTQAELQTLAEDILVAVTAEWIPLLSGGVEIREIYIRDLDTEVADQATVTPATTLTGDVTGDALPSYNTVAVGRRSGLTGRSSRGRIFWLGLADSQTLDNSLATGVGADIVAAVVALDAVLILNGFSPVIVSRYSAGVKRATAVTYPLVAWGLLDDLIDTRRSRKETL